MSPARIPANLALTLFFLLQSNPVLFAQTDTIQTPPVPDFFEINRAARLTMKADKLIREYRLEEAYALLQEAEQVLTAVPRSKLMEGALMSVWKQTANIRTLQGQYDSAIAVYRKDLAFHRETNQYNFLAVANDLNNLGFCYHKKAKYHDAIQFFRQALAVLNQWSAQDAPNAAFVFNNLGDCYMDLGQFDSARVYYRTGLDICLKNVEPDAPVIATCYHNLGSAFCANSRFDSAYHYLQQSHQLYLRAFGDGHMKAVPGYNALGIYFDAVGTYDSMLVCQQKALDIQLRHMDNDDPGLATAYNNLGLAYMVQGNYATAIVHYNKAIALYRKYFGDVHPTLATYYDNLSQCYGAIGDQSTQCALSELALHLRLQTLGEAHLSTAFSHNNLGTFFLDNKQYDQAIEYLTKALRIFQETLGENHVHVAKVYSNLGACYFLMGDFERSVASHRKDLAIQKTLFDDKHPEIALSLTNLGQALFKTGAKAEGYACLEQARTMYHALNGAIHPANALPLITLADMLREEGRYREARQACQDALAALDFHSTDALTSVNTIPRLIQTMERVALVYQEWYAKTQNPALRYEALKNYQAALEALNYQSRHISLASKSGLAEKAATLCNSAIQLNHQLKQQTDSLHYWKDAFALTERSKAFLLYEAMQETRARRVAGIPDALLEQEYNLRVEIAALEKSAWENPKQPANIRTQNESKRIDLNRRFVALREQFATAYPKYYATRYDLQTISVDSVQQQLLQPNQTLLEYAVGDSSLFLFLVQKDHFEVIELDRDSLEQWVEEMTRGGIYGFYTQPKGKRTAALELATNARYTVRARQLYDKLLAPVREKLTNELVIIPDGVLGYLPFEALLTGAPGRTGVFSSYPFLLRERRISYCYSATLLREMRDKQHEQRTASRVLAMAPFAPSDAETIYAAGDTSGLAVDVALRDSLTALTASGDEVAAIAKLWKSKTLLGPAASLEAFRELAPRYPILHLSTHGQADDRNGDYAYLAFSAPGKTGAFQKLYTRDLYNLELNADLVVLSACETGAGKLQRGEGIVSLARGFAYAGAKSLVTTLWKVNDGKTKDLMAGFYQHLKAGKPKDEALHQAKLDFLANNQTGGGTALHPFFWAGFIVIGDMQPLR